MYRVMQCDVPQKIQNMVKLVNNVHSYETRQTLNCYIYPTRTVSKALEYKVQWFGINWMVLLKTN